MKQTNSIKDKLSKLTKKKKTKNNLNIPVSIKEIQSVAKNLSMKKIPGLVDFTGESYQTLKEDIILILDKFFQIIKKEGILFNSFYETSIILIPKPNKDITRKPHYLHPSWPWLQKC